LPGTDIDEHVSPTLSHICLRDVVVDLIERLPCCNSLKMGGGDSSGKDDADKRVGCGGAYNAGYDSARVASGENRTEVARIHHAKLD
jgi:hypothetical protein